MQGGKYDGKTIVRRVCPHHGFCQCWQVSSKVPMDSKCIKELKRLSEKASDARVIGNGTASIVITASEFYAIEDIIRQHEYWAKAITDCKKGG